MRRAEGQREVSEPGLPRWIARLRARAFQPFVTEGATVLDLSAPQGLNFAELRAGHAVVCSPEELARQLGQVDVVICRRVLETLRDPAEILREIRARLKPGGTLVVVAVYDREFRKPEFERSAAHYYSWNVQTLGNLLTDCGFEVIEAKLSRWPNELWASRISERFGGGERGFRFWARVSRLFAPEYEVWIVATRPRD